MLLRQPVSIQHGGRKFWYHGNHNLLDEKLHAVVCSKACPGEKIIEAIDLAQKWRVENRPVISGFHTPVEKECLRIFLRSAANRHLPCARTRSISIAGGLAAQI
jgi:hypothetical protein